MSGRSTGAARTRAAVAAWTAALPAASYDVRAIAAGGDGPALLRRLSRSQLLAAVPLLRARNAAGMHVYARPACTSAVLVDDLDADALDALRAGHGIAAVVETSPHNHQAWVRVAPGPVPAALATAAARLLARRYGGDPCAARWDQVGRLAGFTNRKPIHLGLAGLFPFVLVREARGGIDHAAARLLAEAAETLAVPRPDSPLAAAATGTLAHIRSPAEEWREGAARIAAGLPPGAAVDRSRVDHAVAARLLRRGLPEDRVAAVLLTGDRAAAMPPPAAAGYVARTLRAAARHEEG